ncbi:hypothetical protein GCM10023189_43510 [Nibrella saemangeumensis]|uniref:Transposase n=1 Tax=Nibrella saemangeumensis TaxID=1084526 RepID=A0ABP8NE18_9BACT
MLKIVNEAPVRKGRSFLFVCAIDNERLIDSRIQPKKHNFTNFTHEIFVILVLYTVNALKGLVIST